MTNPHPQPSQLDFQYETALLAEECGEVAQIIGKSFRFGWQSYHPADPTTTNLDLLHEEVGDVLAAVELAKVRGLLDGAKLEQRRNDKFAKLIAIAPTPRFSMSYRASDTSDLVILENAQKTAPATVITQETTVSTKVDTGLTAAQEKAAATVSIIFALALLVGAWVISGQMARESFRLEAAQAAAQCYQEAVTMDVAASTCDALKKLSGVPVTPVTDAPTGS